MIYAENEVYLLVKKDNQKFKIGVSRNIHRRLPQVSNIHEVDFGNSYRIKVKNDRDAYRIEDLLHYIFSQNNAVGDKADGKSEWFTLDCLPTALDFVEHLSRIKGNLILNKGIPVIENNISLNRQYKILMALNKAKAKIRYLRIFLKKNKNFILSHGFDSYNVEFFCINRITREEGMALIPLFSVSHYHGGFNLISHVEGNNEVVFIYFEFMHYYDSIPEELKPEINHLYNLIIKIRSEL